MFQGWLMGERRMVGLMDNSWLDGWLDGMKFVA